MKDLIKRLIAASDQQDFALDDPPPGVIADVATNAAFVMASRLKQKPQVIAQEIAERLSKEKVVKKADAVNGFINIILSDDFLAEKAKKILNQNKDFGRLTVAYGKKARVEFISANPTGPLHIGNARGGPLGDVIASVLQAVGYKVLREYLHNDIGGQVKQLGETIVGTGNQYQGEYIKKLRQKIKTINPEDAGKKAVEILFDEIMADCQAMGIKFDKIYKEGEFLQSGQTKKAISRLNLRKHEGALWFEISGERDTVVVRSTGEPTYFANDITYHDLKFVEGYDLVIDILGSNHHGHVPKLQKIVKDLGYDLNKFKVLLYQFVRVKRGNEIVKMSKRAGDFVTAREVLDEVGKDAFRFFMLMHDPNTHMDFDLELAKKKSQENPVYYAQYAAVRCKSILKKSQFSISNFQFPNNFQITNESERKLIIQLIKLPDLIEEIAQTLRVHQLTQYTIETARLFHDFYEKSPVIKDGQANQSRLALVQATLIVLSNVLDILGISVPESM